MDRLPMGFRDGWFITGQLDVQGDKLSDRRFSAEPVASFVTLDSQRACDKRTIEKTQAV